MRKTRSEAKWNELSAEQLQTLDKWLFEDKLSYAKILPRAQNQLGFKGQMSSLKSYFQRRQQERLLSGVGQAAVDAAKVEQTGAKKEVFRSANMSVFNAYLFEALRASPEKFKQLAPLVRVMVQNDHNDALREIKDEEYKLRRESMAFAKERHQFALMEQALKALPQLKELAEAKKDRTTKRYEENAYWNSLRRKMFGDGINVHPQSAEEEAQMAEAKKAREERERREEEVERNAVRESQPPVPASPSYQAYIELMAKRELDDWDMAGEYEI